MKTLLQISILIISFNCISQSDKIINESNNGFTCEKSNGDDIGYKTKLIIDVHDLKNQPSMYTTLIIPNSKDTLYLTKIRIARKSYLGSKTKSKNGLSYDVQIMEYQSTDKTKKIITYLDPKIIFNNQITSN